MADRINADARDDEFLAFMRKDFGFSAQALEAFFGGKTPGGFERGITWDSCCYRRGSMDATAGWTGQTTKVCPCCLQKYRPSPVSVWT
jgi:hypothetical protein